MRIDLQNLDLQLANVPIDYDDSDLEQGRALGRGFRDVEARLRKDGVRPQSLTWTTAIDRAKAPITAAVSRYDTEQSRMWARAEAVAKARIAQLSRLPTNPVEDAQLARLRERWATVDPVQRSGQLLNAARQYASGQGSPADEAVIRAAFTAPEIWGAPPLFDEMTLKQAEAIVILPEVGPDVLRAKLTARLVADLRQALRLTPEPIHIQRPGGRAVTA
jgi:hypothetical protein